MAGQDGRRRAFLDAPVVAGNELDHGEVHGFRVGSGSGSVTPMPTATATRSNKVAAKVAMTATWEMRLVRMMLLISPGRSEPIAEDDYRSKRRHRDLCDQPGENGQDTGIHRPNQIAALWRARTCSGI